jgi:all-trans-retinol 13,14-reductase
MAPLGHHVLEITTVCPYQLFQALKQTESQAYKAKKREIYQQIMSRVRELIPDVDKYIRLKVYGTPTTSEYYLGQPEGNMYGAKLIPQQIGLHRLGYHTQLPNLLLVGASAGYPGVPGVINNGMDVTEILTGQTLRDKSPQLEPSSLLRQNLF